MRGRIISENVVATLLISEDTGGVLSAIVIPIAESTNVPVQFVVHHSIMAGAVQTDANSRVEGNIVVVKKAMMAIGHHQTVLTACDPQVFDKGMIAVFEINSGSVA